MLWRKGAQDVGSRPFYSSMPNIPGQPALAKELRRPRYMGIPLSADRRISNTRPKYHSIHDPGLPSTPGHVDFLTASAQHRPSALRCASRRCCRRLAAADLRPGLFRALNDVMQVSRRRLQSSAVPGIDRNGLNRFEQLSFTAVAADFSQHIYPEHWVAYTSQPSG